MNRKYLINFQNIKLKCELLDTKQNLLFIYSSRRIIKMAEEVVWGGENCGIQKKVLHAGKGQVPSFKDGTKVTRVLQIALKLQLQQNCYEIKDMITIHCIVCDYELVQASPKHCFSVCFKTPVDISHPLFYNFFITRYY